MAVTVGKKGVEYSVSKDAAGNPKDNELKASFGLGGVSLGVTGSSNGKGNSKLTIYGEYSKSAGGEISGKNKGIKAKKSTEVIMSYQVYYEIKY